MVVVPEVVKVALNVAYVEDDATTDPEIAAPVAQSVTMIGRLFLYKKRVISVVLKAT